MTSLVIISNLSSTTSRNHLLNICLPYGDVEQLLLTTDLPHSIPNGCSIVRFSTDEQADSAVSSLDGKRLDGVKINAGIIEDSRLAESCESFYYFDAKRRILVDDFGDGGGYYDSEGPNSQANWMLTSTIDRVDKSDTESGIRSSTNEDGFLFFRRLEYLMYDSLAEHIIPSDDHSPGAQAARVAEFVDRFLAASPFQTQEVWREGLNLVNGSCGERFAACYLDITTDQQIKFLTEISQNEFSPSNKLEDFFVTLKRMTWDVYYRTPIGIHLDLQYKGNSYNAEFIGCEQSPESNPAENYSSAELS